MNENKKKVYIRTFGCQMNDRDSEALTGLFVARGYFVVQGPEEADVILVNTCSVREHAENRALSLAGSFKKLKNKRKTGGPVIGVIGCMARNLGEKIIKRMPHVDLLCGPAVFYRIPEYVEKIKKEGGRVVDLDDRYREEEFYSADYRVEAGHAQVVISVGCSNYCSYCVVPFVRGELKLRGPYDIVDEVKRNADSGIKRIILLGQNVNDYNYQGKVGFVDLLRMVADVEGIEEIDFVTSHPRNTSRELFELMRDSGKIKKHLHLPFQSGSNRILELMNRGYTREKYLGLVNDYRGIVGGSIGTDIIVGFPTETEEDFLMTKDLVEKVGFNYAYIFKYSPRPGTAAQKLSDDVLEEEKGRRHGVLLDLQKKISLNICPR